MNSKISFRLVYKTEYTHIHLFICIYRYYLFVCPPIVPFPTLHYPIPLLQPPLCVPLLLCLYIVCPFGHYVFLPSVTMSFTYSVPYVIMASASLLLYLYILSPLCLYVIMSSVHYVHSGFINVKYFYKIPILSVTCEWQVGQYPPFLSRTFRDNFVSINKTIGYKIKQRRQNSENHKFIYVRRTGKEMKERKNRCKK